MQPRPARSSKGDPHRSAGFVVTIHQQADTNHITTAKPIEMKHSLIRSFILGLAVFAAVPLCEAAALSKNISTPGTLAAAVGADTGADELTVTGTIDVTDLDFIAGKMTSLRTLNLSGAQIAAWEGKRNLSSRTSYAANELPALSLAGCRASSITLPSGLTAIADGALAGTAAEKLVIPSSVKTIGSGAFAGSESLVSVEIPAGVQTAGSGVFRGCTKLREVTFPIVEVPDYAFADCTALMSVALDHNTTVIGNSAFAGCTKLESVTFPGTGKAWTLTHIGDNAFRATALKELDLTTQERLHTIGAWAFADCTQLTKLLLAPYQVFTIGDGMLFGASALTEYVPAQPRTIPTAAFKGASSLDMSTVGGNSAVTIMPYAFYGMNSLTNYHLQDNLTFIGSHAFDGCTALQVMNGPAIAQVPELGEDVWGDLDRSTVTLGVPSDMISLFSSTPVWEDFNIQQAGIDPVTSMNPAANPAAITAAFSGTVLEVSSADVLGTVTLYDLMGRTLWQRRVNAESVSIETSAWQGPVFILSAVTPDGLTATTKIAR